VGKQEIHTKVWWKAGTVAGCVVDKDVVRKTLRTLVLDRRDVMVWIGRSWLMMVPSGGHFVQDNELSGSQRSAYS
jgi:hypothetical protein